MTQGPATAALGKSPQSAAGSFFEALANLSAGSAPPARQAPVMAAGSGSQGDDTTQSAEQQSDRFVAGQAPSQPAKPRIDGAVPGLTLVQNSRPQAIIVPNNPKVGVKETATQPKTSSSATSAPQSIANDLPRPQMSSTALAAKIAAAVVLPSSPSVVPVPVTAASPLPQSPVEVDLAGSECTVHTGFSDALGTSIPFASAPLASPVVNSIPDEKNRDANPVSSDVPAAPVTDCSPAPARTQVKIDPKPQPPALKAADTQAQDAPETAAAQQDATRSEPTDVDPRNSTPQIASVATASLVSMTLPQVDVLPAIAGKIETAKPDAQTSRIPDMSGVKSSDAPTSDAAAKTSASQLVSTDSSVNATGNTNRANQHAQATESQPAPAPSRSADPGTAQAPTIAVQGAPRETVAHVQTDAPADAARPSDQPLPPQAGDVAEPAAINTARLIQSMSQTEMRVGMHSPEFGDISIRTMVSQQQMTAQISVDHGELASAISTHIPDMQEKLGGDTGLRAMVEVSQGNMSFSGERGGSAPRQQANHAAPAHAVSAETAVEADQPVARPATWAIGSGYRLDIRA